MSNGTTDETRTLASDSIVYVVDDDGSMREAVKALLRSVGIGAATFENAEDFLTFDRPDLPACLIVDVRLKGYSGLVVQERCRAQRVCIPIIFMTGHGDVAMSVRAMKAGATDFLVKPFHDQDMLDAVVSALDSDRRRRKEQRSLDLVRRCYAMLTPREREVMQLTMNGLRNKQIAAQLQVSEITVKVHRNHAMKKMESRSLAEFVLKGRALGIETELDFRLQED
jgi:RNA polymerase sigma factor (sigma-70 family)